VSATPSRKFLQLHRFDKNERLDRPAAYGLATWVVWASVSQLKKTNAIKSGKPHQEISDVYLLIWEPTGAGVKLSVS
jgi:hypothetical protein